MEENNTQIVVAIERLKIELNEALERENSLKAELKDLSERYTAKALLCEQLGAKLDERNAQVADNRKDPELQAKYEDALKRISEYQDAIDMLTANDEKLKNDCDYFKGKCEWLESEYEVLKDNADRYDELMNKFAAAYMKEHFGIEVEA